MLARQDCLVEANCFGLIGVIDSPSGPKSSSTGYWTRVSLIVKLTCNHCATYTAQIGSNGRDLLNISGGSNGCCFFYFIGVCSEWCWLPVAAALTSDKNTFGKKSFFYRKSLLSSQVSCYWLLPLYLGFFHQMRGYCLSLSLSCFNKFSEDKIK